MFRRLSEWFIGLFSLDKDTNLEEKENENESDESDTDNKIDADNNTVTEDKENIDGKLNNSAIGLHFFNDLSK